MDKIDLQILSLLQENARIPLKKLAEKVFLSSPATAARIERLERAGIITSYTAKIDLKKIVDDVIIMNTPIVFLCKEDCKGLCPNCGANLNDGGCKCETK